MTLEPAENSSVTGVVVIEPASVLDALDKREWRYRRVEVGEGALDLLDRGELPPKVHVYVARPEHYRWGDSGTPIRQSYLDCVLKGFLDVFGREGVATFLAETEGWHVPIRRDRAAPGYARAVTLAPAEAAMFDAALRNRGARYL